MFVPMTDMLARANKGHYGIMAINCLNLEGVYATIKAAEAENAPIIIDLLEEHMEKHIPREYIYHRQSRWRKTPWLRWPLTLITVRTRIM